MLYTFLVTNLSRRAFVKTGLLLVPAAVVAPELGLIEKARKYFFAPKGGWQTTQFHSWRPEECRWEPRLPELITIDRFVFVTKDGVFETLYYGNKEVCAPRRISEPISWADTGRVTDFTNGRSFEFKDRIVGVMPYDAIATINHIGYPEAQLFKSARISLQYE
jgi:hypothetical protein